MMQEATPARSQASGPLLPSATYCNLPATAKPRLRQKAGASLIHTRRIDPIEMECSLLPHPKIQRDAVNLSKPESGMARNAPCDWPCLWRRDTCGRKDEERSDENKLHCSLAWGQCGSQDPEL